MNKMDTTDENLIGALRRDGRASLSDLAQGLGLSRTTVRTRLDRLRRRGEIVGFSVLLKRDIALLPVRGLMMLEIEGRGAERIRHRLLALTAVQALHATNGRWDMIVEIGTNTLEELDGVLARIRNLDGVRRSETSLLLSTRRPGSRQPLA